MPDFQKILTEKREWRELMSQVKSLPEDYRFVYKEIQKYVYLVHPYQVQNLLTEIFRIFQDGAVRQVAVLELTSQDVARFVDVTAENLA